MRANLMNPGVYRSTSGEMRMLYGVVLGKCIQSYGTPPNTPVIHALSGSAKRFRNTMGGEPVRAFTRRELEGYLPLLIAYRPRRLCNKFDRWLFFTPQGKAELAALIMASTPEPLSIIQAREMPSKSAPAPSHVNKEAKAPIPIRLRRAWQNLCAHVAGVCAACARRMRSKRSHAGEPAAASYPEALTPASGNEIHKGKEVHHA